MSSAVFKKPSGRARVGARALVWKEVSADTETPVSAYLKIRKPPYGFLFESVEGGERIGRYSFLGSGPSALYVARGYSLEEIRGSRRDVTRGNPMDILARRFARKPLVIPGLPRFEGGLVGYVGYDAVRYVEKLPDAPRDDRGLPDMFFMLQETVLVFDRVRHTIKIIAHAGGTSRRAFAEAEGRVEETVSRLGRPQAAPPVLRLDPSTPFGRSGRGRIKAPRFTANMSRARFIRNVKRAKHYIRIGDIIQTVLSQRLSTPYDGDPFTLYRALRVLNPSPYLFFLECGEVVLAGSSPEMMVRVEGDEAELRPIAGTRPRGRTPAEDERLEKELIADPKERAEHVMLVDLGRNDLGRVCRYGSVRVHDSMVIERYSHVIHLVSGVRGRLRPGRNAFDVLRASFPAGTVSGAPKIRAMEIIDELEPTRRGPYAGVVGYMSFTGNMDTAIAIRTIAVSGGRAYVQAGMGIVADSVPAKEYQESMAKARAALLAIEAAKGGVA